jgi:Domain of unknown function (DUF222)/HNH endonuclease
MELAELLLDPTGVETWRLGESELVSLTAGLSQRMCELDAVRVRMVAQLEEHGTAKTLGAASTAAWLSGVTRMSPGTAAQIVNLGHALLALPATAGAVSEGRISTTHAKVIVGFFDRLPDGVPEDARPGCEAYLLDAAMTDNPVELARRAAALRHMLEPVETAIPDAENTALNELFASVTLGGRGVVKADLDAETMEMLHTALSALAKPHPCEDGTPDKRSAPRRRAEAFTEMVRRYLDSAAGPVEGYERPHLSLLINADDLAAGDDAAGPVAAGPVAAGPLAETDLGAADRGAFTAMFGANPIAPGWMPWIGPISAASARRIACDCELTTIRIDGNGVPLNLGRSQRLVSPQQRRALIARDHGCAFPGCGRPPAWTDAHHIRHWIDGGTTDLVNLVLLCRHHHRTVHHNGWDIVVGEDQHPWFRPPAWMDPSRQPRPAHHRPQHHHPVAA